MKTKIRVEFDQAQVEREMHRRGQGFLARAGEHIASDARASIRPSVDGRSSRPGEPPRSHTGRLREGIVYGFAPDEKSVAIGALPDGRDSINVPAVLEHGGRVPTRPRRQSDRMLRASIRSSQSVIWGKINEAAGQNYGWKGRLVVIVARPFLQPALERAMFHTVRFWEKTIDG